MVGGQVTTLHAFSWEQISTQASAEGSHLGNVGAGLLIECREFCILLLNNHLRANNSIILCYYFHIYIHGFILHLLLVSRQIPVSLKIDVESKQLCYLKISAKKGDSEDILKRNNRIGYNHWDADISVFPWFASVRNVPFRLNTQNTPQLL